MSSDIGYDEDEEDDDYVFEGDEEEEEEEDDDDYYGDDDDGDEDSDLSMSTSLALLQQLIRYGIVVEGGGGDGGGGDGGGGDGDGSGGGGDADADAIVVEADPEATRAIESSDILSSPVARRIWESEHNGVQSMAQTSLLCCREAGVVGALRTRRRLYATSLTRKQWKSYELDAYGARVFCGDFSRDGQLFMAAAQDMSMRFYERGGGGGGGGGGGDDYDDDDGDDRPRHARRVSNCLRGGEWRKLKTIQTYDGGWSIINTAFSPDSKWAIYTSWSNAAHLYNVHGAQQTYEALDFEPSGGRCCLFSSEFNSTSTEILAGSSDSNVYIYDVERRQRTTRIEAHTDDVNAVRWAGGAFGGNDFCFFSGSDDATLKLWDRRQPTTRAAAVFLGHLEGLTFIDRVALDEYGVVSNSKDQSAKLWDVRRAASDTDETRRQFIRNGSATGSDYRYGGGQFGFQFNHSHRISAVYSGRRRHKNDTSLMTYRGGHVTRQTLLRARLSPASLDGQRRLAVASADAAVAVYDVLTGGLLYRLEGGHSTLVRDVSFDPLTGGIASASWDGSVRMWSLFGEE